MTLGSSNMMWAGNCLFLWHYVWENDEAMKDTKAGENEVEEFDWVWEVLYACMYSCSARTPNIYCILNCFMVADLADSRQWQTLRSTAISANFVVLCLKQLTVWDIQWIYMMSYGTMRNQQKKVWRVLNWTKKFWRTWLEAILKAKEVVQLNANFVENVLEL